MPMTNPTGGSPGGSTLQPQWNNAGAFAGMSGWTWDNTNTSLTVTGATVTASKPVLDLTQTWNNGAVDFTGYKYNVINGASFANSSHSNWLLGGLSLMRLDKDGSLEIAGSGSAGILRLGAGVAILSRNGGSGEITLATGNASFPLTFSMGGTVGQFVTGGFVLTGLLATSAAAPTIASAATIAPTKIITFISGTTIIDTITAPAPIATRGGQITLIPTGAWSTSTAGNVALATTAVANKALILTYDTTTAKWYPSY